MFGEESTVQTERKESPIKYYLKWVGHKKTKVMATVGGKEKEVIDYQPVHRMEFWDSESKSSLTIVPESFIVLDNHLSSITGYNPTKSCGIISNYVRNTKKEEFVIRLQKEGYEEIAKGLWDDIKAEVTSKQVGGKFTKNLLVLESGLINNYQFSGIQLAKFNEDIALIDTNNYKVEFDKYEDFPDGEIPYSIPRWKQGKEITKEERNEAIAKVEILKEYFA